MIKIKLNIDHNNINGFTVKFKSNKIEVWKCGYGIVNHLHLYTCETLEEAIKFCVEQ